MDIKKFVDLLRENKILIASVCDVSPERVDSWINEPGLLWHEDAEISLHLSNLIGISVESICDLLKKERTIYYA